MDHLIYMERCPTYVGIKKYLEALHGDNYDGFGTHFCSNVETPVTIVPSKLKTNTSTMPYSTIKTPSEML
jgi:hypothetical protein